MKEKNRGNIFYISESIIIAVIITIIALLIFSIVLAKTDLSEDTMIPIITTSTAIAILIGAVMCGKKVSSKGIINGGLVGGIYIIILYVLSSLINREFSLNLSSIILIIVSIITGIIGGIIGVNFSK